MQHQFYCATDREKAAPIKMKVTHQDAKALDEDAKNLQVIMLFFFMRNCYVMSIYDCHFILKDAESID